MRSSVYYNEFEPFAVAWLKKLIEHGLIPKGDVDDRSIEEVTSKDIEGYSQCHFFAGIGGWALALAQAGWGDRPVWTGSCPCQPFSSAGKQKGVKDERHLWPQFFNLIRECKPAIVFGEQVAAAIGKGWLDLVFGDLEQENYACGSIVFGAHSVGGPHIRQRLYWLGDSEYSRSLSHKQEERNGSSFGKRSTTIQRVADSSSSGLERSSRPSLREQKINKLKLWKSSREERQASIRPSDDIDESERHRTDISICEGFWKECEWLSFRDRAWRSVEPGAFPLVDGVPARVGRLRGYGNALCVPTAKAFVESYLEVKNGAK